MTDAVARVTAIAAAHRDRSDQLSARRAPAPRRAPRASCSRGRRPTSCCARRSRVLNIVGLVMILSASSVAALSDYGSSWYFFDRQLDLGAGRRRSRSSSRRASTTTRWRRIAPCVLVVAVVLLVAGARARASASSSTDRGAGSASGRCACSRARSRSSRCSCCGADVLDAPRRLARTTGARGRPVLVVLGGARRARDARARPRLDDRARAHRGSSLLVVGGRAPEAPRRARRRPASRSSTVLGVRGAVPAGAHVRVPAPVVRTRANTGYQIAQSLIALGSGGVERCRPRRGPGQVDVPPERAHRLHLRDHRRGARPRRLPPRARAVRRVRPRRLPRRAQRARSLRHAARRGRHRVDRRAGRDQPRRGRRAAAGVGHHAAVPVGRWLVARDHDARRGHPRQRRAPDAAGVPRGPAPAAPARAGPAGERAGLRAARRRRDRWSHLSRRSRSRRSSSRAATSRRRSASSAAGAGSKAASSPRPASRSTCLPGRGLQRRLTLANVGVDRRRRSSAFVRAFGIVRRYRPRVVVGFGGYASLPCVVAARFWRVPRVVHEQDAAPGLANRIGVRLGARAAVSLPGTPLPGRDAHRQSGARRVRAISSGTPQRSRRCSPSFGGAQGARTINRAAARLLRPLARPRRPRGAPRVRAAQPRRVRGRRSTAQRRAGDALAYELVGVRGRTWTALLARATLAVCRAGRGHGRRAHGGRRARGARAAARRAERPSDAQRAHARATRARRWSCPTPSATRRGSTRSSRSCSPTRSGSSEMGDGGARLGRPDAAARVADLVEEHARAADAIRADRRSSVPPLDLDAPAPVHIVGVGGVGMSAIALLLARMGHTVSGSDIKDSAVLARLAAAGVDVHVGNRAENVPRRRRRGRVLDRDPAARTSSSSRRASAGIPVLHRVGRARRARGDPRARSRSPARTARPRRRRCSR